MKSSSSSNSSQQSDSEESDGIIYEKKKNDQEPAKTKKIKKEKDRKSEKKDKKGKDKKKKKHDKHQRKDKKKKEKRKKPKWGRYGIISVGDLYARREEFMMWLSEIKCFNIESLTTQDEKRYFEEFVECYNTATFPSEKYYNFKMWYDKGQQKVRNNPKEIEFSVVNDEVIKRKELQQQKENLRNQRISEQYNNLHIDSNLAAEMQEEQKLKGLMRHQFMVGNHEAALKIQKQLEPKQDQHTH